MAVSGGGGRICQGVGEAPRATRQTQNGRSREAARPRAGEVRPIFERLTTPPRGPRARRPTGNMGKREVVVQLCP